ncbi:MAG: DUF4386 domain-containing protein [Cytophagales bacterium]|nr:DUF4386 domain-containing protein [Cytophagales bacterium]
MEVTASNTKTARLASALFFFVCVPMSLWDQTYVLGKVFVPQDPVATSVGLLSNEFLFRTAIVSHLAGFIIFAFMILLFYSIFKSVDKHLSRLVIFSLLAQVPVVFVFEVFNYAALMVLKTEARPAFDAAQQQEVAYFLMRLPRYATGAGMGKLFLGLCFIPFGMLVFRSKLAPRIIGMLLIIGGVGYVADCCIAILLQRADYVVVRSYLIYTTVCYALALLWFLVKGVRNQTPIGNH